MNLDLKVLLLRSNVEEPSDELVSKRQQSIDKYSHEDPSLAKFLNLVSFIFSLETDASSLDSFRKSVMEFDREFSAHGRIYELKILAYATILYLFHEESLSIGPTLALAVTNCFGFGLREKPRDIEVIKVSEEFFQNYIVKARSFTNPLLLMDSLTTKLNEMEGSIKNADFSNAAEVSRNLFQKLASSMKTLSGNLDLAFDQVNKNAYMSEEESRILLWVVSNYSIGFDKPWTDITTLESCVAIAKELSDLVTVLPGPITYQTIINRVLETTKKKKPRSSTILAVVSSTPLKLKETIVNQNNSYINNFTPIHYAIRESLESDSKQKLMTKVNKVKINPTKRLAPSSFAIQFYRERIYIKGLVAQETKNE